MGILDRLTKLATTKEAKSYSPNGSIYAPNFIVANSSEEELNQTLAGKFSPLHANQDGSEGYSLNGAMESDVRQLYNNYDNGTVNNLPLPSKLNDPQSTTYISINRDQVTVNYTSERTYLMSFDPRTY
jgi:hypothetical protein